MTPVLITTSGTGSRLSSLTQHTNKSLIPLGDKLAICYIVELYPLETEFVVTIGYKGHLVKEFLTLAYPERKFTFVTIDLYEGNGSSLGFSMLQAKSYLQTPFIFHCCDTIVTKPFVIPSETTMFVAKCDNSTSYSTVSVKEDTVSAIHTKGTTEAFEYLYTGLSYIKNYSEFWVALETLYKSNPDFTGLSDIHALQKLLLKDTIKYQTLSEYYDTGNLESLKETSVHFKKAFDVLDKNNESLCFFSDRVLKFVNDSKLNTKRIARGKDLYPMTPRLLDSSDHFISMELIEGTVLSEVSDYGEITRLLEWAKQNHWVNPIQNFSFKETCSMFYKKKTLERINALKLTTDYAVVNGITTGTINELLERVDFASLETDTFYRFHGDFILDNIIRKNSGEFVLLDWRHEFGDQLYLGDMYYDLAKLNHNIIFNHKNITNKLFSCKVNGSEILVDLKCNYFLMRQLSDLSGFLERNNFNSYKVKILTSLIWLNMAPLYEDPLRSFLFYFGKLTLALALQERP
jgi:choline kinase